MRFKLLLMVLFTSLISSGCATIGVAGPPASIERNILFEDTIYAVGKTSNSQDLVLIGQQKTYLITHGSNELLSLMKLNPVQLKLNKNGPIYLEFDSVEFTSNIEVSYSSSKLTQDERAVLSSISSAYMNGQGNQKEYFAKLAVRGNIYAKEIQAFDTNSNLSQSRDIKIVTSKTGVTNNTSSKTFALPLAIAFDIITSPIQIIMLPKDMR